MNFRRDKVRVDRLEATAKYLDKMERKKFYFGLVRKEEKGCGSTCCAVGETPNIFPELGIRYEVMAYYPADKFNNPQKTEYNVFMKTEDGTVIHGYGSVAAHIFGLELAIADALFTPGNYIRGVTEPLKSSTSPKRVAKNIRRFIKAVESGKDIYGYDAVELDEEEIGDYEYKVESL